MRRIILPQLITFFCSFFLGLVFLNSPVLANHLPRTTGFFCKNNAVWQDVYYLETDTNLPDSAKHKLKEQCGTKQVCTTQPPTNPIYFEDASCVDINSVPIFGDGTTTHVIKSPVTQGEQLTLGIGEDKVCHDAVVIDPNDSDKSSLKVFGRLNNCHVTDEHCGLENKHTPPHTNAEGQEDGCNSIPAGPEDWSINSPHDVCTGEQIGFNPYDNKQCFKTVICDTNSQGNNLDAPLITGNPICNNSFHYEVAPNTAAPIQTSKNCKIGNSNVTVQNQTDLVDQSLADDKRNVGKWLTGTVPTDVIKDVNNSCLNKVDKTGVLSGAFGLQNFICNSNAGQFLKNVPLVGALISSGTVCPKNTFAGGTDFDCFHGQSVVLDKSASPDGVNDAQAQDCSLVTYMQEDGKPSEGKIKMDNISRAIGGPNGYMSITTPDYPLQLNNDVNINSEGHPFTGSDIGPDINARCDKDCLKYYPPELCQTNQSIQCDTSTNSTTTTVPTANYACRQACFTSLDDCQNACDSKTGHDKDNCNNECVQTKDKCLPKCGT